TVARSRAITRFVSHWLNCLTLATSFHESGQILWPKRSFQLCANSETEVYRQAFVDRRNIENIHTVRSNMGGQYSTFCCAASGCLLLSPSGDCLCTGSRQATCRYMASDEFRGKVPR